MNISEIPQTGIFHYPVLKKDAELPIFHFADK